MEAAKPLNYAPKPSATRRTQRWALRVLAIFLVLAVATLWIRSGWSTLREIYWERACLRFLQPPGHIVFEINRGTVLHDEICVPESKFLSARVQMRTGSIFLHELRRPDGTRRLVLVNFEPWWPTDANGVFRVMYLSWEVSVVPKPSDWSYIVVPAGSGTQLTHWKFFAGQPDPADLSHFTFEYEVDGTRHTCDAWLKNDGKLVISQRP
jgi:hypothetical protein